MSLKGQYESTLSAVVPREGSEVKLPHAVFLIPLGEFWWDTLEKM
jgi:hypothetical protein